MKLDENTIKEMFSDMKFLISKMQKEDYSKNFEIFESKYTTFFENMVEAFDLEGYTSSMPLDFFEIALNDFKRFGKVRKSIKVDVSMFLIYFRLCQSRILQNNLHQVYQQSYEDYE